MTAAAIDRTRLAGLLEREQERFVAAHPRSAEVFERARGSLLHGVPMHWMIEWAGPFPVVAEHAEGARLTDVDGNTYVDLCMGDTGAMAGHSPPLSVEAIRRQAGHGITLMLPTGDAAWVGEELARRFGLPSWQFCLSATDANRFSLRLARAVTGRPKVLVYNWCYHGTVDETVATIRDGAVGPREGSVGPQVDPALTTKVVEWNDLAALEQALAPGDVACVIAEPAMTNIGIIPPDPGYHEALREITRRTGTLLLIDETHTICAGPGGYTRAQGLEPDILVIGKAIAAGVPAAAYGFAEGLAERIEALSGELDLGDVGGVGGTLAGNALSVHAMRATLEHVLTAEAFERMIPLCDRLTAGVEGAIAEHGLPWHVVQLGCRAEYRFRPEVPRNGSQAAAAKDGELDALVHLYMLNRGVLLTPFHNMALMCPATTGDDVDRHTRVLAEVAAELVS